MSDDAGAWQALLDRHAPFALALARDRLRRSGAGGIQPEDLVQGVWVELLKEGALARIDPALGLRSYLAVSVIRAVHRHLRTVSRRRAREEARPVPPAPEAPDEPLLRTERDAEVEEALLVLAPEDRLLLRWIYWDGLSYAEVAEISSIRESSVGPLLSRVRERFREAFKRKKAARDPAPSG